MWNMRPIISLRTRMWHLGIGRHAYVYKVSYFQGTLAIILPGFVLTRGYY
jgi:hypothetical protein